MNTKSQSISLLYRTLKWQKASMEVTFCKCCLVTSSEREDKEDSTPVFTCVCSSFDSSWTFTPYKIKRHVPQRYLLFYCTYICIKLNFTYVCLLSPSHSLLIEHWSWVSPVSSLCAVRKPGANIQMVSKYLKNTVQLITHNGVVIKKAWKL